jgi:hypothetical protein
MELFKRYGADPVWSDLTFEGPDVSLEISLLEYHLVWALASDGDYKFVYRIPSTKTVLLTDWASCPADTDVRKEWNWVNFNEIADAHGVPLEEWLDLPFPQKVRDLFDVHGHENIFGTSRNPQVSRIYDDLVWLATTEDETYTTEYCDLVLTVGPTTFSVGGEKFTFEGKFRKGAAAAIAHADEVLARQP